MSVTLSYKAAKERYPALTCSLIFCHTTCEWSLLPQRCNSAGSSSQGKFLERRDSLLTPFAEHLCFDLLSFSINNITLNPDQAGKYGIERVIYLARIQPQNIVSTGQDFHEVRSVPRQKGEPELSIFGHFSFWTWPSDFFCEGLWNVNCVFECVSHQSCSARAQSCWGRYRLLSSSILLAISSML